MKVGVFQQDKFTYDFLEFGPIPMGGTKASVTRTARRLSHVTGKFIKNHRFATGPSGFPYLWSYLNWNPNRNCSLWFYGEDKIQSLIALKKEGKLLGCDFLVVGVTSPFRPRNRQDEAAMVARLQQQQTNPDTRQNANTNAGFVPQTQHNSMIVSHMYSVEYDESTSLYHTTGIVFKDPRIVLMSEEDALAGEVTGDIPETPGAEAGDALDQAGPTPYKGTTTAAEPSTIGDEDIPV